MTDSDLTLKVLVEMRDEMRATNKGVEGLRVEAHTVANELHAFRTDFNQRVERLEQHASVANERLDVIEHTLVDFGTQVVLLGRYMKNSVTRHDGDVERHDEEIADLRTRVEKLEAKD
jgi:hypothetical protein